MDRAELEHIIRASASIAEDDEIYVLGSQSILGAFPDAPGELTASMEADVAPKNKPDLGVIIEGSIGELSPFHTTFGYYAENVDVSRLPLSEGWGERLIVIQNENTRFAKGLCLEPHDCAASKLHAGREKDIDFVSALLSHGLVDAETLRQRLRLLNRDVEAIARADAALDRCIDRASGGSSSGHG